MRSPPRGDRDDEHAQGVSGSLSCPPPVPIIGHISCGGSGSAWRDRALRDGARLRRSVHGPGGRNRRRCDRGSPRQACGPVRDDGWPLHRASRKARGARRVRSRRRSRRRRAEHDLDSAGRAWPAPRLRPRLQRARRIHRGPAGGDQRPRRRVDALHQAPDRVPRRQHPGRGGSPFPSSAPDRRGYGAAQVGTPSLGRIQVCRTRYPTTRIAMNQRSSNGFPPLARIATG
jgi:hypothetical protein